jgi:DNA-binding CsgD family transcriptional regulator/tetratricopeptide (TPR) repeat protein
MTNPAGTAPAAPPAYTSRAGAPLLVGRAREQALLRDRLAAALAGRGSLVLIGGGAGIGKTALAEALGREAAERGALVLVGRCYDLAETPPYGPWGEVLDRFRAAPDLPPALRTLPRPSAAASASRAEFFAQVRNFLATAAAERPLVVLLDDLHWTDPASLDLLRYLARGLGPLPLLLVATYRADELTRRHPLAQLLPALVREAPASRVELRPLGDEHLRALVRARYALPPDDEARLAAYLQRRAEGNPFFIGELLHALEEEGLLRPGVGGWRLGDLGGVALPALLRQVLDGRLDRLGDGARGLLAIAAVLGQEVPLALWARVALVEEEPLLAVVERAVEAHLLAATEDGLAVRFAHALVREALYAGLLPPRRRVWHRRAAEALLALPAPDPDAVAEHFRRAGDERAVEWLVHAGDRAQRAYAWRTAAERFEAALALLDRRDDLARERGWLRYRLGVLYLLAEPERALAALDAAAQAATVAGDAALAANALYYRGMTHCCTWALRQGLAELEAGAAALEALPDRGPVVLEALGGFVAAPILYDEHNPRGAVVNWLTAVGRYAEAGAVGEANVAGAPGPAAGAMARAAYGDAYLGLALAYAAQGRPEEARRAFAQAREAYGAVDNQHQIATALWAELRVVLLPYEAERVAERRHLAAEAERAAARASEMIDPARSRLRRLPLLLEGAWGEIGRLAPAVPAGERAVVYALAQLAREQGDVDLAWALVREDLPEGPETAPGDKSYLPMLALQRLAAALALDAGDLDAARAWLGAHDRWLAWSGSVLYRAEGQLGWAAYHRAAGDLATARQHAARALAHAVDPRQPLALLAAHRLAGEIALAAGDHPAAGRHLDEALALAEVCAAPFERALSLLALAALRRATGDRGAAEALLAEMRALCEPLGARRALALADALLPRRPAPPPGGYPAGLTARGAAVLALLAAGRRHREIAAALFLSVRTVDRHTENLYRKLDARGRADAVAFAARHGLLPR